MSWKKAWLDNSSVGSEKKWETCEKLEKTKFAAGVRWMMAFGCIELRGLRKCSSRSPSRFFGLILHPILMTHFPVFVRSLSQRFAFFRGTNRGLSSMAAHRMRVPLKFRDFFEPPWLITRTDNLTRNVTFFTSRLSLEEKREKSKKNNLWPAIVPREDLKDGKRFC